jgi:broad specificity phosphatase PhoE
VHSVTIYYIRHGENLANLTREFSHRAVDHPLTQRGADQARQLAAFLAACPPVGRPVFSSPLRRALQTAEIVAGRLGSDVKVAEDLRELDVGDLDGRRDAEAWATHDAVLRAWESGHGEVSFPGGEDHAHAVDRMRRGLSEVVRACTGSPAVVVGHRGVLRAALTALCPAAHVPERDMGNCTITELAVRLADDELTGSLVCWAQRPELAALAPGTGRRRAAALPQLEAAAPRAALNPGPAPAPHG